MNPGTGQAAELHAGARRVRLLENGLLDLSETPGHLVDVVRRNATESPLLCLPAELRRRIFEYAMSGYYVGISYNGTWDLHVLADGKKLGSKKPPFQLPKTSRQVYAETATLGYALTTFAIMDAEKSYEPPSTMWLWAMNLTAAYIDAVTAITLPAKDFLAMLRKSLAKGHSLLPANFRSLARIHLYGPYAIQYFARRWYAEETGLESHQIKPEMPYRRYVGWTRDQVLALIQQQTDRVVGGSIKLTIDLVPTDI